MDFPDKEVKRINAVLEGYKTQVSELVGEIIFLRAELNIQAEELAQAVAKECTCEDGSKCCEPTDDPSSVV